MLDKVISSLGDDITITPKKDSISYIRKRQFALIKPSTSKRMDIGIQLKGVDAQKCLEISGSWNAMVSHRVQIADISDVNQYVIGWLKEAYERAS